MKKIRKLYNDKQFVAALSVILMTSCYPIINGWLFSNVGGFWTLVYMAVTMLTMLCHVMLIMTKMFPRFTINDEDVL